MATATKEKVKSPEITNGEPQTDQSEKSMATAIKEKPAHSESNSLVDERVDDDDYGWESLEAAVERESRRAVLGMRLLAKIESKIEGPIEPGKLHRVMGLHERNLLKAGGVKFKNDHELCRLLQKERNNREWGNAFSFEKLEAAKIVLDKAREAVRTTAADMSDLDVDVKSAEPALVRQLKNLQRKLDVLRATESQALQEVVGLQALQRQLEANAPQILKDLCKQRRLQVEDNPKFRELQVLEAEVARHEQFVQCSRSGGVFDPSRASALRTLVGYAQEHCKSLLTTTKDGLRAVVDADRLREHVGEVKQNLPTIKAELSKLQQECDQIMKEADPEGPIRRWIADGGFISSHDLV